MNLDKIKSYILKRKEEKSSFYASDYQYQLLYKFPWSFMEIALKLFIKLSLFPPVMAFYLNIVINLVFPKLDIKQMAENFILYNDLSMLFTLACIAIIILVGIKAILSPLNKRINFIVSKMINQIKGRDEADIIDNDDVINLTKFLEKSEMRTFLRNKKKLTYSNMLSDIERFEKFNNVKILSSESVHSEKLEEYLNSIYEKELNK